MFFLTKIELRLLPAENSCTAGRDPGRGHLPRSQGCGQTFETGKSVLNLFYEINKTEGTTIVIVTHDNNIGESTPRCIKIFDGKIKSLGKEEEKTNA